MNLAKQLKEKADVFNKKNKANFITNNKISTYIDFVNFVKIVAEREAVRGNYTASVNVMKTSLNAKEASEAYIILRELGFSVTKNYSTGPYVCVRWK